MSGQRPRYLRPGWLLLTAIAVGLTAWKGYPRARAALTRTSTTASTRGVPQPSRLPAADDTLARPPAGVRVRVQVVNATTVRGLGRRATFYLRDRGFDVLEVGTTRERQESTLVLDRSGHPEWARRVAHAMGGARVDARPDSSRYLDVTVLVGLDWRPPSEPFHP
jgi:hypothetical protein